MTTSYNLSRYEKWVTGWVGSVSAFFSLIYLHFSLFAVVVIDVIVIFYEQKATINNKLESKKIEKKMIFNFYYFFL